jgi:hypothetical protein
MLHGMRNQVAVLAAVVALALAGCDRRSSETKEAPRTKDSAPAAASPLGDLSTSLADVRAAFNARKGEARFLTLLSPT